MPLVHLLSRLHVGVAPRRLGFANGQFSQASAPPLSHVYLDPRFVRIRFAVVVSKRIAVLT